MTHHADESTHQWKQYYHATSGRPPRDFLRTALRCFQTPAFAIDLGCGTGSDSIFMLQHDWQVLAVDQQETAV